MSTEDKKSWSELNLVPYPFMAVLLFNEKAYDSFCEAGQFTDRTWLNNDHYGDVRRRDGMAVVRFDDLSAVELDVRVGIFAHEATHVFQALCAHISESSPSAEFQAYTIQAITQWIFKEHQNYLLSQ